MIQATQPPPSNGRVSSHADEHYRALVRRLQQTSKRRTPDDSPGRTSSTGGSVGAIGVTSSRRGEGVSTVAANLAVAAAELSLGPVVLVDANLQQPCITDMFGLRVRADSAGFVDVLLGEDVHEVLVSTDVFNLSVMTPGKSGENRQLLNDRSAIQNTLDQLHADFEWIIFDLPPATELSECFALSGQLDGVLMVVQADGPPREIVRRACRELEIAGANVLGAVLNKHK